MTGVSLGLKESLVVANIEGQSAWQYFDMSLLSEILFHGYKLTNVLFWFFNFFFFVLLEGRKSFT